ncbi:hypothetical protein EVA_11968 [gut metagenome]|uniref:DUF4906 domain-containing protein n=1 Tax=gut metagenome TaxID=749906 RepID=J9GJW3_9ZZZZ
MKQTMKKIKDQPIQPFGNSLQLLTLTVLLLLLGSCQDEWERMDIPSLDIEEGIPGELALPLCAALSEEHQVSTRSNKGPVFEQHIHSAYVFIIDQPEHTAPQNCRILSRKYFPDLFPHVKEISEQGHKLYAAQISMPAVSSQRAQIFAIANLGYSDLQGIDNDAEMLERCDTLTNLQSLMDLSASLAIQQVNTVNVERMQGHHLMSGFFCAAQESNTLAPSSHIVSLKAETGGRISVYNPVTHTPFRPLGTPQQTGTPAALLMHRLDAKITVRIEPAGTLKETPGAFFRLLSWQVLNTPVSESLYGTNLPVQAGKQTYLNSKLFQRDLTQGEDGSWEFTFYQFENLASVALQQPLDALRIAEQYNKEYGLNGEQALTAHQVTDAFTTYPNAYSDFAYTLRELKTKNKGNEGQDGVYKPEDPTNDNQTIIVKNGGFEHAPQNASYIRLVGNYYNPDEPVRRKEDDPNSIQQEKDYPLHLYPYWGPGKKPVMTPTEALKRTRSATVVYYVHLGYVGGANYSAENNAIPATCHSFEDYQKKLNDYNICRNHHYTYTLKVAGVENIRLEATREEAGNILEQEKQPGAEGAVLESQHMYLLDAHYETRNLTIDFSRMPENYSEGFSFAWETPFDKSRCILKKKENGGSALFDKYGKPMETIRGHDLDWIHFAWHGTMDNPSRSLVDATTGNGISYSETYGGYENQQTYDEKYLTCDSIGNHPYKLLNSLEFTQLVWRQFVQWLQKGKPEQQRTMTFTVFVDENYYDFNPVTNAQVDWYTFCNRPKRMILFFMEPEKISADQSSWYADAHVAIYQQSIQTLYATDTDNGQVVANVAFGIEALDEFRSKYSCSQQYNDHYFTAGISKENGLYNTMKWFKEQSNQVIDWKTAESYFTEKWREHTLEESDYNGGGEGRDNRRGQWALYSRNRDLNRNGKLESCEIRWFVPAIDQYTLCFLGGRPVFENPLFEKDKAVKRNSGIHNWLHGVPVLHYMSSTNQGKNQVFWAEEGCSKGNYGQENGRPLYGIRMARMLCGHGVKDTGEAFDATLDEKKLQQDALFTVSQSLNGIPVDYSQRTDGKPYYILINKINANAFREKVRIGELAHHTHEQKENWLYRSYRIARHKIGYTSYESPSKYNRTVKINGVPRTWWQVNGVWTPNFTDQSIYDYRGEEHSLAYNYYEDVDGSDLHRWRMPNLREAALMSMAFSGTWFEGVGSSSITSCTKSENLGPQSTNIPYWNIQSGQIARLVSNATTTFFVRAIQDI